LDENRIACLGNYNAMDFERLRAVQPELVLTWDMSIIPILEEMKVPCAITTASVAMCLSAWASGPVSRTHFLIDN